MSSTHSLNLQKVSCLEQHTCVAPSPTKQSHRMLFPNFRSPTGFDQIMTQTGSKVQQIRIRKMQISTLWSQLCVRRCLCFLLFVKKERYCVFRCKRTESGGCAVVPGDHPKAVSKPLSWMQMCSLCCRASCSCNKENTPDFVHFFKFVFLFGNFARALRSLGVMKAC